MRIPRIYHPQPLEADSTVTLSEGAARHVSRVLRLSPGDSLTLFDGLGGEFAATIQAIEKRSVVADTGQYREPVTESSLQITLAQGVSKGDRMDFTIQKAVELGIHRIVPLGTERSVVNLKGDRLEKKMSHWRGVIISACEQCGRNTLPELLPLQSLQQWLTTNIEGTGLILDHRANGGVSTLAADDNYTLLIGPEGGLSAKERETATAAGYQGLKLGPRVLRTETAALTALAALQSRFGDLG